MYRKNLLLLLGLFCGGCASYHGDIVSQTQCANIKHEMMVYQNDPNQMRTLAINRHYLQMQRDYQDYGCVSPIYDQIHGDN